MTNKKIQETPILVANTRTGKNKFWKGYVVQIENTFFTMTEYWQQSNSGEDTKHQFSEPYEAIPTNVGKKNERNSKEQAIFELDSMISHQRDKGYHEVGKSEKQTYTRPMLAQKFKDRENKGKIKYPLAGQPKLNGMRCVFNSDLIFWSRTGKPIVKECVNHLWFDTKGYTFDGELMIPHGDASFQDSMSAAKKYRKGISEKLKYYIYDIIDENLSFKERNEIIKNFKGFNKNVVVVETVNIKSKDDVLKYQKEKVKQGYEGTIYRDWNSKYKIEHRSEGLLKYKDFMDEEFKIVDVVSGDGRMKDMGIFICITKDKKEFRTNPEGTDEVRRDYLKNKKKYIGKMLSVRFIGYSDDGIPLHSNGIIVRDYE